jgi:hypothetical protein
MRRRCAKLPDRRVDAQAERVCEEVEHNREESRRLGLVELANPVRSSAHRIQAEVTALPQLRFASSRS